MSELANPAMETEKQARPLRSPVRPAKYTAEAKVSQLEKVANRSIHENINGGIAHPIVTIKTETFVKVAVNNQEFTSFDANPTAS